MSYCIGTIKPTDNLLIPKQIAIFAPHNMIKGYGSIEMDYLKNGVIREDTSAPGLQEAREKLRYYSMSDADRHAYDEHINAVMIQNDVLGTARLEGRAEGVADEKHNTARKMLSLNIPIETIMEVTGLSEEEIRKDEEE